MIFNLLIASFYLYFIKSKVKIIALPLFVAASCNIVLWLSQTGMGDSMFLMGAIGLDIATIFLLMNFARLETKQFLIDGVLRQSFLLIVAASGHVLQLIDINEGTNFIFDNYGILINLIIILQIFSLGVTMYGERIRNNWAYLRNGFASLPRSGKSNRLYNSSSNSLGNIGKSDKLAKIKKGSKQ